MPSLCLQNCLKLGLAPCAASPVNLLLLLERVGQLIHPGSQLLHPQVLTAPLTPAQVSCAGGRPPPAAGRASWAAPAPPPTPGPLSPAPRTTPEAAVWRKEPGRLSTRPRRRGSEAATNPKDTWGRREPRPQRSGLWPHSARGRALRRMRQPLNHTLTLMPRQQGQPRCSSSGRLAARHAPAAGPGRGSEASPAAAASAIARPLVMPGDQRCWRRISLRSASARLRCQAPSSLNAAEVKHVPFISLGNSLEVTGSNVHVWSGVGGS